MSTAVAVATPTIPDAPGMKRWSDDQIRETVMQDLGLAEVSLTRGEGNKYTGTGRNAAGSNYVITVDYRAGEYLIDYTIYTSGARTGQPGRHHWTADGVQKQFGKS